MRKDQEVCPDCKVNIKTKKAARCKPCNTVRMQRIQMEKLEAKEADGKALEARMKLAEAEIAINKPMVATEELEPSKDDSETLSEKEAFLMQQLAEQHKLILEMQEQMSAQTVSDTHVNEVPNTELDELADDIVDSARVGETTPDGKYYL